MSIPFDAGSAHTPVPRRHFLKATAAAAAAALPATRLFAQGAAPLDMARLITGFAAGGTSDTLCRRLAARMTGGYARSVIVENRTGAGGQIAIQAMKGLPADGTAILQTPMSMLGIYPHIYKKLPYDPLKDVTPVSIGCVFDFGFAVGPAVSGPIGDFLPHLAAGKCRILATSGAARNQFVGSVPTFTEQGLKDMAFSEWFGLFLPAGASADVVQRASAALRPALASPEIVEGLAAMGLKAESSTPAELAARLKADHDRWGPIVKSIGFTAES